MTCGELFAGIGGIGLGLERAGMEVRWQVEKDEFCRRVLAKHWPDVKRYEDVRDVGGSGSGTLEVCGPGGLAPRWREPLEPVDLIAGGFPCQDLSYAGKGAGLDGERSGLWDEFARIIRELRPTYVLVENVPALFTRGFGEVLGDLADSGYNAEWSVVSACSMGAPHVRQRLFVVAYTHGGDGWTGLWNTDAHTHGALQGIDGAEGPRARSRARLANPSALYGGAHGVAHGMDRNRSIGNSVHPDVAEYIGRRIMSAREEAT